LLKAFRAEALFLRGDVQAACGLYEEVLRQYPNMEGIRPLYAQALSALGQHDAARAQLSERVKEVALLDHDIPYWLACAYAMEGEADDAIYWLKKAITAGNENIQWFKSNPTWQSLQNDKRFTDVIEDLERRRAARQLKESAESAQSG
jgi:tetratricopeptide (TPR) repeat protein